MLDGADASLSELAEKSKDEELQKRYLDVRDLALANREVLEGQFRTRYMGEFQKRTNRAKKIGESLSDVSLDDMELVGEDDFTETLKFNDMAAKLRRYCEARGWTATEYVDKGISGAKTTRPSLDRLRRVLEV